ncbi:MAG: UDP-glucose/GDP-mannose dehydrogenase family protein [Actinomycetota bacterium]|nr:UDP-glucose/GDP-mannose dehydrogenase family protein [Actinomycetota bacterium]
MLIAVIGAGYVGLVTAAGLASLGHRVRVGEADPQRLEMLEQGEIPFFEPDLGRLVAEGTASGLLTFQGDNREAVDGAEVLFVALPTPSAPDGSADTRIVDLALDGLAPYLLPGVIVVMKSTMPVGSVDRLQERLREKGATPTVISNPEFLREGSAVADFLHPDRIVVGSRDQRAAEVMVDVYRQLQAPVVVTDPITSEMIKYAANAFLASRVTFANAIANLCEGVGADVRDVLLGMGYDRRIGFHFLSPGPGFGGSCFPKDTRALVAIAEQAGYDFALLKGVIEVNEEQRRRVLEKVRQAAGGNLREATVGLWGLAFKAGTDDIRESPAVDLAQALMEEGALVRAYDPKVSRPIPGLQRAADPLDAAKEADVLLIATEWPEFQAVDFRMLQEAMRGSAIVDARNLLDPAAVRRLGFTYTGIGR